MIAFSEVSIGESAETPCLRCAAARPNTFRPSVEVLAEVAAVADSWADGPGPNVTLVGAEPFAHPELPLLVRGAVEAGCERVRLRTDAGALGQGGNATGVLSAGVRHLEVVVLGGAELHDVLTGHPGALAAALDGLAAYAAAASHAGMHVAITGRIPVCRHNRDAISDAVLALVSAGAVSIELAPVTPGVLDDARSAAARQVAVVNGAWLHFAGGPDQRAPWRLAGGAS